MINKKEINKITNKEDNNNFITLQFTLFDSTGKYKPLSTLIKVQNIKWFKEHKKQVQEQAIQQICNQRGLSGKELAKLGYTKIKVRNYTLYLKTKNRRNNTKEERIENKWIQQIKY